MKTENNSLLHDLVDPVKNFAEEVHSDTIGDAKRFYSAQAQKMKKNAEAAKAEAARRREELKREQEELKKHRRTAMKSGRDPLADPEPRHINRIPGCRTARNPTGRAFALPDFFEKNFL